MRRHVEGLAVPALEFGALAGLGLRLAGGHLLRDDLLAALVEHVGAALEEQHAEDVFLELRGVHLAAQDVGGLEEVAFELGEGQGHLSLFSLCRFASIGLPFGRLPDGDYTKKRASTPA